MRATTLRLLPLLAVAAAVATPARPARAQDAPGGYGYAGALGADLDKKVSDGVARGRKWLLAQRDPATGAWDPAGPIPAGYTGLAVLALVSTTPREAVRDDPVIAAGLAYLASKARPDGSIVSNPRFVNYETSIALSAFSAAKVGAHGGVAAKAREFLVASQVQGADSDPSHGGFPYESKSDPTAPVDLSNAQHAATAAHDAGVTDAGFWSRLLVYLGRVQNRSETNTVAVPLKEGDREVTVVSGNDGGAGYAPGRSKAGYVERPDGRREPRSYGSMTYALLKCLLFAGAKADDPRVQAAVAWLSSRFTVDRNPGFEDDKDAAKAGMQGYYYYLVTMARALAEYERATGKPLVVRDASGRPHEWRRALATRLLSLQREDGSWVNEVDRWEEGDPRVVTSYALQALATAQGRAP